MKICQHHIIDSVSRGYFIYSNYCIIVDHFAQFDLWFKNYHVEALVLISVKYAFYDLS